MKSTQSMVSGRSNYRLFFGWIVATSCLGAVNGNPLYAQLPPGLPPSTLPTQLPTALPPAPLPALPGVLPSLTPEQPGNAALPKQALPAVSSPSAAAPRTSGAVQVRLGAQQTEMSEPPRMSATSPTAPAASTVSIAIDPIQAAQVARQSTSLSGSSTQTTAAPQGPVKFSLGDEGVVDLGVQRTLAPPTLIQRAPELVRPKKYSVAQIVTVAADADLTAEPALTPVPKTGQPIASQPIETVTSQFVPAPLPPGVPSALPTQARTLPPTAEPKSPSLPIMASATLPAPPVASTAVASPAAPPVPAPKMARTVNVENTYDIEVLGTYTIDPSLPVASVGAQDPEVCNVFHNGRMITVVGNKVGSTVIEIQGTDQSVRAIGVKVLPTGRLHASAPTELDKVKGMIAQHFPTAKLSFIQQPDGGIQVKGTATSEADARRILELIRKLCLVPIHDQIKVSY